MKRAAALSKIRRSLRGTCVGLLVMVPASAAIGSAPVSFTVAAGDVVMGEAIGRTDWSTRLATPSAEGQFEILVRKSAAPVQSPHCASQYLVIRMPASLDTDDSGRQAIRRKIDLYKRFVAEQAAGHPLHLRVFAGPYGHFLSGGALSLTGCNLFFAEPEPPGR
jgi:hypothetical protein